MKKTKVNKIVNKYMDLIESTIIKENFDVRNIENDTKKNDYFRKVLYTSDKLQLVVMSLLPKEEIGMEVHKENDQFFRIDEGEGKLIVEGKEYKLKDGFSIIINAGTKHNIINTSPNKSLKLYTIYSPPHHPENRKQKVKPEEDH